MNSVLGLALGPVVPAAATAAGLFVVVLTLLSGKSTSSELGADRLRSLDRYLDGSAGNATATQNDTGLVGRLQAQYRSATNREESVRQQRTAGATGLAADLGRADLSLRPTEWRAIVGGIAVVAGGLVTLRFNLIAGLIIAAVLFQFGGPFYLRRRHRKRAKAFAGQLADVILMMANGLKAGHSFAQSLDAVALMGHPPANIEFGRAAREIQLGVPTDEALRRLAKRNESDEMDLVVSAVQIQRVVGGNLAEFMERVAGTIRERVRIKGVVRTLTAQARASAWVISLLPVGLAGLLSVITPDYFRPMFADVIGLIVLGVVAGAIGLGIVIMQKIVKVEL